VVNRRCCRSRQICSAGNPGTDPGMKDPVAGLSRDVRKGVRSAEHWASQEVGMRAWQVNRRQEGVA
jgi:hypothetical protein